MKYTILGTIIGLVLASSITLFLTDDIKYVLFLNIMSIITIVILKIVDTGENKK